MDKHTPKKKNAAPGKTHRDEMHKRRVARAEKTFERRKQTIERRHVKRDEFLARNDQRLENIRRRNDEILARERTKMDRRIERRRSEGKIRDEHLEENLERRRRKTDRFREEHVQRISKRRKLSDKRFLRFEQRLLNRAIRRLKRIESDERDRNAQKVFNTVVIIAVLDMIVLMGVEIFVPGSTLKRYEIIDDTIRDSFIKPKEPSPALSVTEEQYLWDRLMDHFDGNEVPVLGIMCNLYSESEIRSNNLENLNNQNWTISDVDYTDKVNRLVISKQDFIKSKYKQETSGYLNDDNVWRNKDGGYGYAQYTSSDKKEALYEFASSWYDKGGPGEGYRFDISNPEMQANFIIYLLEHDYKNIDKNIRNSKTIVDACYIWLKKYEIPYDPYKDGYYTLAFKRAECADMIREHCTSDKGNIPRYEDPTHTPDTSK